MKFLFLLLFAIPVFSQLPDRGTLADLKGKTKVYVIADGGHYDAVKKVFNVFTLVNSPDDAEFFVVYKTLSRDEVGYTHTYLEHGQLDAYYYRDKARVIAWSNHLYSEDYKAAGKLAKRFIKEWRKLN